MRAYLHRFDLSVKAEATRTSSNPPAHGTRAMRPIARETQLKLCTMLPRMPWERRWISTRGLPPWRPEVQRAGGPHADGYWTEVYAPSADEIAQEGRLRAAREAAAGGLAACRDAADVIKLIRGHASMLPEEGSAWRRPFSLLYRGGVLVPPTHQFHRMQLALPQRLLGIRKIIVASTPHEWGWEIGTGRFADPNGHVWCTNYSMGEVGDRQSERLLQGEVPSSYVDPWVGTGTSKPSATVATPVGQTPTLVVDYNAPSTRRCLCDGVLVSDYSAVWLPHIVPLIKATAGATGT
jgi:hypothetical protein